MKVSTSHKPAVYTVSHVPWPWFAEFSPSSVTVKQYNSFHPLPDMQEALSVLAKLYTLPGCPELDDLYIEQNTPGEYTFWPIDLQEYAAFYNALKAISMGAI